jgi:Mg-chelatase subunit ChlD
VQVGPRRHRARGLLLVGIVIAGVLSWWPASPAAAQACPSEVEPNDAVDAAAPVVAPTCVTGSLTQEDAVDHLLLWTIGPEQAAERWDLMVSSPEGSPVILTVSRVTSDPAAATLSVEPNIVEVRTDEGLTEAAVRPDLWLPPGRYLLSVGPGGPWTATPKTYRADIEPATPLPASADQEPNDDPTTAAPIAVRPEGGFEASGDAAGTDDYFAWYVEEAADPGLWTLEAQGSLGATLTLTITDGAGTVVGDTRTMPDGMARLPDLRLEPGPHTIRIVGTSEPERPFILRAYREDLPIADSEPNDDPARALPIVPGELVTGRLARYADWDAYRLTIDETLESVLIDARVIVQSGPPRRVCLSRLTPSDRGLAENVQELTCSEGPSGANLPGLLLGPGDYQLVVAGPESLIDPYYLRVDTSVAPVAGFELEPNDTPAMATLGSADEPMRGRLDGNNDHVRVHLEGEPQLWEAEATGPDVRLTWVRTDGYAQGIGVDPDGTQQRSVISDAYLIPGDHWFRLDGTGEYSFTLQPLGPPIPGGEREPNDALPFAGTLPMGGSVTGRLWSASDRDLFRFSLAAPEHVLLTLEPPPGVDLRLYGAGDTYALLSHRGSPLPGEAVELDLVLPAGDHAVEVQGPVGAERYRLSLRRADPFDLAVDQEPNDEPLMARPLSSDLRASGIVEKGDLADWYRLEPLPAAGELFVRTEGSIDGLMLDDGSQQVPLMADVEEGTFRSAPLAAGAVVAIGVMARGPYVIALDPGTTGLVAGSAAGSELPMELVLDLDTAEVAAFEAAGQRVPGLLNLTNSGQETLDLRLDALASDPRWAVELESSEVSLAPGASVGIALEIVVPAQAWDSRAVRVTLQARDSSGQATTFIELTPRDGVPLVEPFRWWPLPDELLGGLDVAAPGLGAVPLVSLDAAAEAALHDGVVALGAGMNIRTTLPLTLTMDLAGDEPVPVAGIILDPTAGPGAVAGTVRAFELLLSQDGATYERALSGELSGALIEQAFALPEPVPARYAQLRITSRFPGTEDLRLGEWKVVAAPGWTQRPGPIEVSDPLLGGHIAWFDPQVGDWSALDAMLMADASPWLLGFDPRETSTASFAIGFQDGRAAQVTELAWIDPPGSRSDLRLSRLELASSLEGPTGPWTPLGTWRLERDAGGAVEPFRLESPIWARYIRFRGPIPNPDGAVIELPDAIRVLERETSPEYRSVVGEWGYASQEGPYEWQQPVPEASSCLTDRPAETRFDPLPLEAGEPASGCVARGEVVDTYTFTVPAGQQAARFTVTGRPTVGVGLTVRDESGVAVALAATDSERAGSIDLDARVTPGATYRLEVNQPPFSVAILFDTSGSVGPFVPIMTSALRSYLGGIVAGEEALQLFDLEGPPLPEDFSDDPWLILNALDAHAGSITGSSAAEAGLIDGLDALASRVGTRAIFLMTDADTSSFHRQAELWRWLDLVGSRVFATQVSGTFLPRVDKQLMQDWAAVGSGAYDVTRSGGDIERAFDKMGTWLRRPAEYELVMTFSEDPPPEPEPGSVRVMSGPPSAPIADGDPEGLRPSRAQADIAVALVVDTSGSMLKRLGGRRRIDVAKDVLANLVAERLPPGTPVALRHFRQAPDSCETELIVPLGPLDRAAMGATVKDIEITKTVRTPLAAAIAAVADDLAGVTGPRLVVVVSDGRETCGGDPEAAVRSLVDQGIDVSVNVVGLGLDRRSRREIARLAEVGNGRYYDARAADELAQALKGALGAPYVILDASGAEVGRGTVDGPAVELPPGAYVITLAGASAALDAVVIESGERETVVAPAGVGS